MSVINTTTTTINIDFNKKPMWRIKVGGGESEINIAPASDGEGGANFGSFEDAIEACKPCPSMTGILELIKKGELDDGDRVNVARLSVFKLERNGSETHLFQWRGDEALEEDLTALHQKRKGKQEVLRILIEDREVNEELAELLVRKAGGLALLAHDWVMEITERSGREALLIDTARCIIGGILSGGYRNGLERFSKVLEAAGLPLPSFRGGAEVTLDFLEGGMRVLTNLNRAGK